jgi:hypothetical protein
LSQIGAAILAVRKDVPHVQTKMIMEDQMAAAAKARVHVTHDGVVHVKVSPETMYNLEATQKLTGVILGRLGCPTCCSGRPILFEAEESEFAV